MSTRLLSRKPPLKTRCSRCPIFFRGRRTFRLKGREYYYDQETALPRMWFKDHPGERQRRSGDAAHDHQHNRSPYRHQLPLGPVLPGSVSVSVGGPAVGDLDRTSCKQFCCLLRRILRRLRWRFALPDSLL